MIQHMFYHILLNCGLQGRHFIQPCLTNADLLNDEFPNPAYVS